MSRYDNCIVIRIVLIFIPYLTIVWIVLILIELVLRTRDVSQWSLITCAVSLLGRNQVFMLIVNIARHRTYKSLRII